MIHKILTTQEIIVLTLLIKMSNEFTERANEQMFEDIYEELAQDYPNQTPQWLHIAAISKFHLLKSNGN